MSSLYLVTGASGYIAGHVIKILLERGHHVRGTVRSLANANRVAYLKELPGAERLELVEADLLREGSFDTAVQGCAGVFHTASPFFTEGVTDPIKQLVNPAVNGTLNVLNACVKEPAVRRVVLTSSFASIIKPESAPEGHTYTEADWNTDSQPGANGRSSYLFSKVTAEKAAWDFVNDAAKNTTGFSLATICPPLVIGPILNNHESRENLNTSCKNVLSYFCGSRADIDRTMMGLVDVRTVAEGHVRAMLNTDKSHRYFLMAGNPMWEDIAKEIKSVYPDQPVPTKLKEGPDGKRYAFDCSRAREELGLDFIPWKESLKAQCEEFVARGWTSA